jgi:hypothetical protein
MKRLQGRVGLGMVLGALALLAASCGGGSGDGSDEVPIFDARNGGFIVAAADGHEYFLALDFITNKYVLGQQQGTIQQDDTEFFLRPGNSTATSDASTLRFRLAGDGVVGEFNTPRGPMPFVGSRKFVQTLAEAAGVYNLFGRSVDAATGALLGTTIRQVELTADGRLRICEATAVQLADCPDAAITTASVSGNDSVFIAAFPRQEDSIFFRVAQVGSDKLLVHGDLTGDPVQRFLLGLPATGAFTPGHFVGGATLPAWGTFDLNATSVGIAVSTPAGESKTTSGGPGQAAGTPDLRLAETDNGNFFAARSGEIAIVLAAPDNALAPGFMMLGKAAP